MSKKQRDDDAALTDEQAQQMLARLTEHFGCRVAPVKDYCRGFYDYMSALREAAKERGIDAFPIVKHFGSITMLLSKSNLAARLIYGGERLRTRKCPQHNGTWSGLPLSATHDCPIGCGLTGWIKEPEDGGPPHGSDPSTWRCTSQWCRSIPREDGGYDHQMFSYEEMLELERKERDECKQKSTAKESQR